MIKKTLCLFLCLFCVMEMSGNAIAAPSINYNYAYDAINDVLTTPYSGMIVETFDNGFLLPSGWNGGAVVNGSVPGQYAAPFNNSVMTAADHTNYLTVPVSPETSGSASVGFGTTHNYLGLFWGSMDSYNTIEFLSSDTVVASYTGADLTNPANGNQWDSSTNIYVNFLDMPDFDEVRFSSSQFAFEIDNVAVGTTPATVPAPGALVLAGLGTSLAGFIRRRRCI